MSLEERVKKLEAKVRELEEWRASVKEAFIKWKKSLDIKQLSPMVKDLLERLKEVGRKIGEKEA